MLFVTPSQPCYSVLMSVQITLALPYFLKSRNCHLRCQVSVCPPPSLKYSLSALFCSYAKIFWSWNFFFDIVVWSHTIMLPKTVNLPFGADGHILCLMWSVFLNEQTARFADQHWSQFHDFTIYRVFQESNPHYWPGITVVLQWLMTLNLMHYSSHYFITECLSIKIKINDGYTPSLHKYIFQVVNSCSRIRKVFLSPYCGQSIAEQASSSIAVHHHPLSCKPLISCQFFTRWRLCLRFSLLINIFHAVFSKPLKFGTSKSEHNFCQQPFLLVEWRIYWSHQK
jgi:hypothetical protein